MNIFLWLKTILLRRRVIKVERGYVAQVLRPMGWESIDRNDHHLWYKSTEFCIHGSFKEAEARYWSWKEYKRPSVNKPKVVMYEIPTEPKFWRVLKNG